MKWVGKWECKIKREKATLNRFYKKMFCELSYVRWLIFCFLLLISYFTQQLLKHHEVFLIGYGKLQPVFCLWQQLHSRDELYCLDKNHQSVLVSSGNLLPYKILSCYCDMDGKRKAEDKREKAVHFTLCLFFLLALARLVTYLRLHEKIVQEEFCEESSWAVDYKYKWISNS